MIYNNINDSKEDKNSKHDVNNNESYNGKQYKNIRFIIKKKRKIQQNSTIIASINILSSQC